MKRIIQLSIYFLLSNAYSILPSNLLSFEPDTVKHKLQNLRHNFTDNGWDLYYTSLKNSGVLSQLLQGNLKTSATMLENGDVKLKYDLTSYSYNQVVRPKLKMKEGKIDMFTTEILHQSKIKEKQCNLKSFK